MTTTLDLYPGAWAARTPDKPAIVMAESGAIVTYAEFEDAANRRPTSPCELPDALLSEPLSHAEVITDSASAVITMLVRYRTPRHTPRAADTSLSANER